MIVAAAIAAFAWLAFSIAMRPLNLPEEGRYVGIAWEMLRSGNWLVPTENGLPFFHKPPLFYWLRTASMRVFGTTEWATRLVLSSTKNASHVNELRERTCRHRF